MPARSRPSRITGSPLLRQATGLVGGRGAGALLSALWFAVVARHLGLASFGELALVLALHQIFFFLADPGTSVLLADHVARNQQIDATALRGAMTQRLRGAALTILAVTIAYAVTTPGHRIIVPLVFAGSVVGNAVHTNITAAFRSIGRIGPEAVNEPLSRAAMLLGGSVWLAHGGGLVAVVAIYSIADLASALVLACVMLSHLRGSARTSRTVEPLDLRLSRGLPVAAGAGLTTFYSRADAWLVSALAGARATGLYAAGAKVLDALLLPATVLGALVITHTSGLTGHARSRRLARFAVIAAGLTGLVSTPIIVFAPQLLRAGFGPQFVPATTTLRVLLVSGIASAVVAALAPVAAVVGGRRFPAAFAAGTAVNVALNLALLPRFGVVGAAWANLCSQVLLAGTLAVIAITPSAVATQAEAVDEAPAPELVGAQA